MAKMNHKDYARETERQMRDRMNGIVRNEDGSIYSRNGVVRVAKIEETKEANNLK